MLRSPKNITIVAYSLCLLYLSMFVVYLQALSFVPFTAHAVALATLSLLLLVSAFFMTRLQGWARSAVVGLNAAVFFYQLFLHSQAPELVQTSYMYINVIAVLYFSQSKVRRQFDPHWKYGRRSILVVDDDEGLVITLKQILLSKGYSVLVANTGERGLQVARVQKPDLILLDVILPGIKGRDVCVKLKADSDTRDIPIIFLTAKDSADDIRAEHEAGAVSHLTKPVNSRLLLAEVKKYIAV